MAETFDTIRLRALVVLEDAIKEQARASKKDTQVMAEIRKTWDRYEKMKDRVLLPGGTTEAEQLQAIRNALIEAIKIVFR